ncbi:MAG: tetratricopeptide repeat protein [Planctomycetota bacterium]
MRKPLLLAALIACPVLSPALVGCNMNKGPQYGDSLRQQQLSAEDDFTRGNVSITADTHNAAGQFAQMQGRTSEALASYRKALEMNPHHEGALYNLGVLLTRSGNYDEARHVWNRFVSATNGSAAAYANLGYCLELAGDRLGAETAYAKGIDADAYHQACRVNFGLLLVRTGRVGEGTIHLSKVLPAHAVLYNIGAIYERQGKHREAAECYSEALDLKPDFVEAQTRLSALGMADVPMGELTE